MKTILALILFLFAVPSQADWKDNTLDVVLFVAGGFMSLAVHEASHAIAAKAYGEKLTWEDMQWVCRKPNDNNVECNHYSKIAVAGNLGTSIVGEALLYLPVKYRNSSFVDGMQSVNVANSIGYAYKDATVSGGSGDYRSVDNRYQVALAVHAASIGYRQFSERTWRFFVTPRGVQFNASF